MGYILALIPPLLDSFAVYLDKFLLSKHKINTTILAFYSGLFAFFSGMLILLITGLYPTDIKTASVIMASGFFGIFYLLAYFKALTYNEGSRVGSLFQLTPVLVLLLS